MRLSSLFLALFILIAVVSFNTIKANNKADNAITVTAKDSHGVPMTGVYVIVINCNNNEHYFFVTNKQGQCKFTTKERLSDFMVVL